MNLRTQKFHMYFKQWIELYKEGAVRPVTYQKYQMSHKHLVTLAPDLQMDELKRRTYQELIMNSPQITKSRRHSTFTTISRQRYWMLWTKAF